MDGWIDKQRGWGAEGSLGRDHTPKTPRGALTSFSCLIEFFGIAQRSSPKRRDCS